MVRIAETSLPAVFGSGKKKKIVKINKGGMFTGSVTAKAIIFFPTNKLVFVKKFKNFF